VSDELRKLLARSWIFSDLSSSEMDALARLAKMRAYRAKQQVVRKGDRGGHIFAVLRGRLKALTPGVGHDAAFNIMGPGELFGEIAAFDGESRSATVTALEICQLAVIDHAEFHRFLDQHPKVSRKLLSVLARRVRLLTERVEDRAFLDVPARLAKCLVGLADSYGKPSAEGRLIQLRLSQQELGDLVDATRESVNKLLRTWKDEGLVTHRADSIVVRDVNGLRALVQRES
jgi:CRP-like cAMP-binding protein